MDETVSVRLNIANLFIMNVLQDIRGASHRHLLRSERLHQQELLAQSGMKR